MTYVFKQYYFFSLVLSSRLKQFQFESILLAKIMLGMLIKTSFKYIVFLQLLKKNCEHIYEKLISNIWNSPVES